MTFTYRPAVRENVQLLVGLAGGTGAGKTMSALEIATGLAGGKRFAAIDTENGRIRHYADSYDFDVTDLAVPFRPERYADAIAAADDAGYEVIVVDSMTHEWDGDGGCLDWQEEEYRRLGGRDAVKLLSWQEPKKGHRKMVTRLLQVNAHVILCFRAAERVEIAKDAQGKTVVRPKRTLTGLDGWVPISEPKLPYELTMSCLLVADAPGIPKPIKLPEQFKSFVPLDQPLSESTGRQLGEWARGGADPLAAQKEQAAKIRKTASSEAELLVEEILVLAAEFGSDVAGVKGAITRNRNTNEQNPGEHLAWLGRQKAALEENIAAKRDAESAGDSLFQSPAGVSS